MSDRLGAVRSMLYVPAHRPEMVAKTARWRPDVVVVDLEDAVPASDKQIARELAVRSIAELGRTATGPARGIRVLIRINPVGSPWFVDDVAAAARAGVGVVLPKLERTGQLVELRERLAAGGHPDAAVVGGIETALGVADCRALLADGLAAAYFGAEDFIGDVGGRRSTSNHEVLFARSAVLLACRLAGIPAVDQAVLAVRDPDRFRADAVAGRELGYQGKICVHPDQVAAAHDVFTPTVREVEHARAVLDAGAAGVAVIGGEMIDEVHLKLARATLARAGTPTRGEADT